MATQHEAPKTKKEGETNPFVEMVKFLIKAILERKKKELAQHQFSDGGQVGGAIKKVEAKITEAKDKINVGDIDGAKSLLSEVGSLFKTAQQQKEQVARDIDSIQDESGLKAYTSTKLDQSNPRKKQLAKTLNDEFDQESGKAKKTGKRIERTSKTDKDAAITQTTEELSGANSDRLKETRERAQIVDSAEQRLKKIQEEVTRLEIDNPALKGSSGIAVAETAAGKSVYDAIHLKLVKIHAIDPTREDLRQLALKQIDEMLIDNLDNLTPQEVEQLSTVVTRERRNLTDQLLRGHGIDPARSRSYGEEDADILRQVAEGKINHRMATDIMEERARSRYDPVAWQQRANQMAGANPKTGEPIGDMAKLYDMFSGRATDSATRQQYLGMYSPRQVYEMTANEVESEFGVKNKDSYEAFIIKLLQEISETGMATVDAENRMRLSQITALLVDRDVTREFGITNEFRLEMKDLYESWAKVHDFHQVYWNITAMDQLDGQAGRLDQKDERNLMLFNDTQTIAYKRIDSNGEQSVDQGEINLNVGILADLQEYSFWANGGDKKNPKGLLSIDSNVREETKKQMLMYSMARQLEGFVDVPGFQNGTPDYSKLTFGKEGINDYIVDTAGNKYMFVGIVNTLNGDAGRLAGIKYDDKGNRVEGTDQTAIDTLFRRTIWAANFAENWGHATGRIHYHDPLFKGHTSYVHRQNSDPRWEEMFGLLKDPEMHQALESRYRDKYSEKFHKMAGDIIGKLTKENEDVNADAKEVQDLLLFMLKDRRNWLMSKEVMLNNWKALMVDRNISSAVNGNRVKVGRWDHMLERDRNRANMLWKKYLGPNSKFDWSAAITSLQPNSTINTSPNSVNSLGMNGFKETVLRLNISDMHESPNVSYDEHRNYYKYLSMVSKNKAAAMQIARNQDPEMLINLIDENYPHMNDEDRYRVRALAFRQMHQNQVRHLKVERYVTDPLSHSLQQESGELAYDEQGQPIYKRQTEFFDRRGRSRYWPKMRAYKELSEIENMVRANALDPEEADEIIGEFFEDFMGLRNLAKKNKVTRTLWSFDAMGWTNHKRLPEWFRRNSGFLRGHGIFRWGPGPIIRHIRTILSYTSAEEATGDALKEGSGIMGKIFGDAVAVA